MTTHTTHGFTYLLDGFSLILKPGIKRFVIIPLLLNLFLFVGLFFTAQHYFAELNHWITQHLPTWLVWLNTVLWLLFFFSFGLVFVYTFVTLANLISAPFNSLLAEKVEAYLTGNLTEQQSLLQTCKDVPRIIARQLAIIGYYLPRAIFILILFFVPVVQMIATFIWFLFNAWFMTLQYVDYPTDNHRIPLKYVRAKLDEKRMLVLSFGASVTIFSMVPLVNFVIVPAAVAGATKLWLEAFE